MQELLNDLNPEQREAVCYLDGPELVIAGAGSGKTRVLTYKIAYLLETGYHPWNILALTFTNKAAREMRERVEGLVGAQWARQLYMGTFHSIFLRILRGEAERIGYRPGFTIYDTQDSRSLLTRLIKEMDLKELIRPAQLQSLISSLKNRLIRPRDLDQDDEVRGLSRAEEGFLQRCYGVYQKRLEAANAMDFDDILLLTYRLLSENRDLLEAYRQRFRYILVDEYQDTNTVQDRIIQLMAPSGNRICVVGDDAQSIYSFRGADIANILGFSDSFPGTRVIKLELNYRSTQTIVEAANDLIRCNHMQIPKQVRSTGQKGDPILVHEADTSDLEAEWMVQKIQDLNASGTAWKDMAVLYRINALSRTLEEKLRRAKIPYRIWGGLSFYQRKEIKDAVSYFRLVANPRDEEAFLRIIDFPKRNIGQVTQKKIMEAAQRHGVSLFEAAEDNLAELGKAKAEKVRAFTGLIRSLEDLKAQLNALDLGLRILDESGLRKEFNMDTSPEGLGRLENLQELINSLGLFIRMRNEEGNPATGLENYLSEISLMTDQEQQDLSDQDADRITLMTIHSAKGLEYPVVFITGLEDGILPIERSRGNLRALEEERRLFYVALTRARRLCLMSYARNRFHNGQMDFARPSPFLSDIGKDHFILETERGRKPDQAGRTRNPGAPWRDREAERSVPQAIWQRRAQSGDPPSFPRQSPPEGMRRLESAGDLGPAPKDAPLKAGQVIDNERFGRGTVLEVSGSGPDMRARILFASPWHEKTLLLRYATYRIL